MMIIAFNCKICGKREGYVVGRDEKDTCQECTIKANTEEYKQKSDHFVRVKYIEEGYKVVRVFAKNREEAFAGAVMAFHEEPLLEEEKEDKTVHIPSQIFSLEIR